MSDAFADAGAELSRVRKPFSQLIISRNQSLHRVPNLVDCLANGFGGSVACGEMGPAWLRTAMALGDFMKLSWNRLPASTGAAALALALASGTPVQAKLYKFTMTEQDADGSTNVGSGVVDSTTISMVSGSGTTSVSGVLSDPSGFLNRKFSGDSHGNSFKLDSNWNSISGVFSISSSSEEITGVDKNIYWYQNSMMEGEVNFWDVFTPAARNRGAVDEFATGEYILNSPYAWSGWSRFDAGDGATYDENLLLNPLSMSLRIESAAMVGVGPLAPAPLAGGGLLSALAALLGLGVARLVRRSNALA